MVIDEGKQLSDSLAYVDSILKQVRYILEHPANVSEHAEETSGIETFLFGCDGFLPARDSEAMWWISLVGAVAVCVFLSCCILNTKCRNWIFHHLKQVAIGVFLAGVMVYGIGFNDEGSENNVLVLLLRACVSSLEMFVSESELIEVKHSLKDSATYMIIFSMVHFAAVFVSAIFILRLFGVRLLSMLRLWWYGRKPWKGPLYVFWGINEHALTVAESIRDENARLVFVKLPEEKHVHSSRFTFSHFFHTSSEDIETYLDRIEALNRKSNKSFLTVADRGLNGNLDTSKEADDLFVQLGLRNLQCMLRKSDRGHVVEFFFLSDDEKKNIGAISLLKCFAEKEAGRPGSAASRRITVYCHARKNSFNEPVLSRPGLRHDVHLVDSSMLAILQLKENGKLVRDYGRSHPVNFVDYDGNSGTVSSVFTALIVGFGETGRDALRFLYEFSAFVRKSGKMEDGRTVVSEQERDIYVVDKHLDELKTRFLVNTPALLKKPSIHWLDMSTHTTVFWDKLKEIIDNLNYVVVAVDDDEEAASIAIRLFDFAYRYRKNFRNFKIYVRLRNEISKRLMKEVDRYNVFVDEKPVNIIEVFGTDKEVLAHENLAAVSKEKDAKDFYLQYSEICRKIEGDTSDENLDADTLWKKRRNSKRKDLNALDNELWIFYQEEQDRSNVCHIYTKLALAGAVGENRFVSKRLDTLEKLITGGGAQDDEEVNAYLIDNLVYTEHIRWNAKMELLGFVSGEKKSMKERMHPCLISCSELIASQDEAIRKTLLYDKGIVELSIRKGKEWNEMLASKRD